METDSPHVPPIIIWGYSCGHGELNYEQLVHLTLCSECQTFAGQIIDFLDEFAESYRHRAA
jgi:hypothetical protein